METKAPADRVSSIPWSLRTGDSGRRSATGPSCAPVRGTMCRLPNLCSRTIIRTMSGAGTPPETQE
jgi:hypothetical protein